MTNPRIGVIGIPGKWSTEVLADALEKRTGFRCVVDMADTALDLQRRALMAGGQNLCELDGLVIKKISQEYSPATLDRLEMLRVAEASGVKIFSKTASILGLVNRLSCTVTLSNAGIPMPETVVTESPDEAMAAVHRFGNAVSKPLFSTKARGMTLMEAATPEADLKARITAFQAHNPVMYLQKKVNLSGRDLGMVFLGGEYLGTYARVAQTDSWNTTILHGGKYEPFEPDADLIELARKAQAPFDLDFTTVDVGLTEDGPIIFEVSAFGGFKGALEGASIDAAGLYAEHVIKKVQT
ncbi:GAK system ATP-grasp enzyme [Roseibium denhamense]|uniref:Ribosomal protein S6--L-glutamate ligase n=1 Tax=Roseibium denhamense TaxID=76305 RepID=A0ABY1NGX2_9HYPH|nr:GAK system ATP-grasp enzyme [Roseibium denhamense]MTI06486.1 GAK system ATP-grasp enzyme [Roseibium denhamense]SMP09471.1 ribosomal protein S6--L-glutamate ligase [Roseibium denhamense]